MSHLEDYVAAAVQQTRGEFVRDHPHPFLLLEACRRGAQRGVELSHPHGAWRPHRRRRPARLNSREAERYRVFALVKGSRNPWPERISIGRARNNDVVLPDQSVSKLHAHFVPNPAGGPMALVDAGSRNGTRVNDTKLASGERSPQCGWAIRWSSAPSCMTLDGRQSIVRSDSQTGE